MLVDIEGFSREFLIEKEMDDLVANAGPANSVTFGIITGCNAAAAASVARSVAVGTSANVQINSAKSVAAALSPIPLLMPSRLDLLPLILP